jgi:hypothetical protein
LTPSRGRARGMRRSCRTAPHRTAPPRHCDRHGTGTGAGAGTIILTLVARRDNALGRSRYRCGGRAAPFSLRRGASRGRRCAWRQRLRQMSYRMGSFSSGPPTTPVSPEAWMSTLQRHDRRDAAAQRPRERSVGCAMRCGKGRRPGHRWRHAWRAAAIQPHPRSIRSKLLRGPDAGHEGVHFGGKPFGLP